MLPFLIFYEQRLAFLPIALAIVVYPLLAWCILRIPALMIKRLAFAGLNVTMAGLLVFLNAAKDVRDYRAYTPVVFFFFCIYVSCVLVSYVALHRAHRNAPYWPAIATLLPIVLLVAIKYLPTKWTTGHLPAAVGFKYLPEFFVGISYLAFRLSHLVQEVRNEVVEMPALSEYLAYAFFVPTLSIGPISAYSKFANSLKQPSRQLTPLGRSLLRILAGAVKYFYLGSILGKFTYASLLRDGHPHSYGDLLLAIVAFPLFLYCNFSGFCDMVIGASGLLCIEIEENFDRPFHSRNFQEFWTRWHITLSRWMRDMMFTPMTKSLIRRFGPRYATHVFAGAIVLVFLVIGIWHGKGLNFALFGLSQGLGLAAVHYYSSYLKARLGKEGYRRYLQNNVIRYTAQAMSFTYFSLSLFLFANSMSEIREIISALH